VAWGGLVREGEGGGGRVVDAVVDGRLVPGAVGCGAGLGRHLGPVVGRTARVGPELDARLEADVFEDLGRLRPVLVGADELVGLGVVAGGQLEIEVVEVEVLEQAQHEVEQVPDLVRGLVLGGRRGGSGRGRSRGRG